MNTHDQCEMSDGNPPGEEVPALLKEARMIAVVGLSDRAAPAVATAILQK